MADLITATRAKNSLAFDGSFSAADDTTIGLLVTAASKAIEAFCKRTFASTAYDELYDGKNDPYLQLRSYPTISVARVAYGPTSVLKITNNSSANQRATAAVTASGLTLVRVASGSVTTDTSITFAGSATLAALATAITALGNGWSASVIDSRYNLWPSADLRAIQGAMYCKDVYAELKLHLNELTEYDLNPERGQLARTSAWEGDPILNEGGLGWSGGRNYWRVIYTAGYATVPEDVQEACAQWVAELYKLVLRDPALANAFVTGTTGDGQSYFEPANNGPSPRVRSLLLPYRTYSRF